MNRWLLASLVLSLGSASFAVVFGQVLSRAVVAGYVAVAALGLACLAVGGGVLALCLVVLGLLWLVLLQLVGFMLVDVDGDHLPALAGATLVARVVALAVFALALFEGARRGLSTSVFGGGLEPSAPVAVDPEALGAFFVGQGNPVASVLGLLLAAALLTALRLLRDEESELG